MKIHVEVFWVVTLCSDCARIPTFRRIVQPPSSRRFHSTASLHGII